MFADKDFTELTAQKNELMKQMVWSLKLLN